MIRPCRRGQWCGRNHIGPVPGPQCIRDTDAEMDCDATPFAGANERTQCMPRSVVEVMLSETAPTDAGNPLMSLISELKRGDAVVAEIKEPDENKKAKWQGQSWQLDGDGLLRFKGRIWVPGEPVVRVEVMSAHHASKLAGHLGVYRTFELVKRSVGWLALRQYIEEYVKNCPVCQRTKAPRQLLAGHLSSLPIPDDIWEELALDFIVKLTLTKLKRVVYDSILVVVGRLSKMALYIPACEARTSPPPPSRMSSRSGDYPREL